MNEQTGHEMAVQKLAESVFENGDAARQWLSSPNQALGGSTPLALCKTGQGAQQVRRILVALEWGGVV